MIESHLREINYPSTARRVRTRLKSLTAPTKQSYIPPWGFCLPFTCLFIPLAPLLSSPLIPLLAPVNHSHPPFFPSSLIGSLLLHTEHVHAYVAIRTCVCLCLAGIVGVDLVIFSPNPPPPFHAWVDGSDVQSRCGSPSPARPRGGKKLFPTPSFNPVVRIHSSHFLPNKSLFSNAFFSSHDNMTPCSSNVLLHSQVFVRRHIAKPDCAIPSLARRDQINSRRQCWTL